MENTWNHAYTVLTSDCDSTGRLGIPQTFGLCMDIAAAHAEALGNGIHTMWERGLFWLVVKTRIRFYRRPGLMERITAATWPEAPARMACLRDYRLTAGTEILAAGKTEWAILDRNTGALHSGREGIYSADLVYSGDRALPEPFHRFTGDGAWEPFGVYTVPGPDVDLGGHMNNAAYIRALAGLFTTEQWNALDPELLEAHYRSSCYEGETLEFSRRLAGEGMELQAIPAGKDRAVFYAYIEGNILERSAQ